MCWNELHGFSVTIGPRNYCPENIKLQTENMTKTLHLYEIK